MFVQINTPWCVEISVLLVRISFVSPPCGFWGIKFKSLDFAAVSLPPKQSHQHAVCRVPKKP